jgi:hypothetical protein
VWIASIGAELERLQVVALYNREAMAEPKPPTPLDLLIADWRSRICPICEHPLDLQQKATGPILWLCAMFRKWFNEKLERV